MINSFIEKTRKEFDEKFLEETYQFREHEYNEKVCEGFPCQNHKITSTKVLKGIYSFWFSRFRSLAKEICEDLRLSEKEIIIKGISNESEGYNQAVAELREKMKKWLK